MPQDARKMSFGYLGSQTLAEALWRALEGILGVF